MSNPYKKISSKIDYQNKYFTVKKDEIIHPNGAEGVYYVIEFPHPVFVVAITEEQEIYLVGLHRYTTDLYSWEVPAGGSEGQDKQDAAKRELLEETGLVAGSWKEIGKFQISNGNCNKIAYTFLATDVQQTDENKMDEEGITAVKKVPIAEVLKMIEDGRLTDADSIAAIMQAIIHLKLL